MAGFEFEKAVELDPQNAEAHAELGAVYEDMGQIDKALEYYKKALETTFKN